MRHGSLFSGIGGFDLAAEWMGWENVFHCEINEFGQKILKYYWPNAISYTDIKTTDFAIHRGQIDILTGGFPCQPFSAAGKRKGTEDDRHLWPEMLRAIREISPRYIVGENVRGITNWNGGMVFDQVQADLEVEGFEVLPFLLPACAINAPHRRDRIWFVAHSKRKPIPFSIQSTDNANKDFWEWNSQVWSQNWRKPEMASRLHSFLIQRMDRPYFARGTDGVSSRLDIESIRESLKGYGNAVQPKLVYQIFKAIQQHLTPAEQ